MRPESATPGASVVLSGRLTNSLPLAILGVGIVSRLFVAIGTTMLHGDEGMHLDTGHFATVQEVIRQVSVAHAHPPLYFLLLHWGMCFTENLLAFRVINIALVAGSAWFFYTWLSQFTRQRVAIMGLALYFCGPGLHLVSLQVRGYSLLLLGICGSLEYFQRTLTHRRATSFVAFLLWSSTACLTHYSAAFFLAGLGVNGLAVALAEKSRGPLLRLCVLCSAVFCGLYAVLWSWHKEPIAPEIKQAATSYLWRGLYPGSGYSLSRFVVRANVSLVRYLFGRADWVVLLVLGLVVIFLFGTIWRRCAVTTQQWRLGLLLGVPWLLSLLAAIFGVYPHHGNRHSIFLLPCVVAAMVLGFAALNEKLPKLTWVAALSIVVWAVWTSPLIHGRSFSNDGSHLRSLWAYSPPNLQSVLNHLKAEYRTGDLVVLPTGDNFYFRYYVANDERERWPGYPFSHLGQHRVAQYDTLVEPSWTQPWPRIPARIAPQWCERLAGGHSVWLASFQGDLGLPPGVSELLQAELFARGSFALLRLRQHRPDEANLVPVPPTGERTTFGCTLCTPITR